MRKISAHYIYTNEGPPLKNGVLVFDNEGTVVEVRDTGGRLEEEAGLEFHNGIIMPGFVNAHCHLELSHMAGRIEPGGGLPSFISQVGKKRQASLYEIVDAAERADRAMWNEGIVAVGDISNADHTFPVKQTSPVLYHTFLEVFGFSEERIAMFLSNAFRHQASLSRWNLRASVVPHAPYSVPEWLFEEVARLGRESGLPVSVHNQETASEDELFRSKSGALFEALVRMGLDFSEFQATGKSSLASFLPLLAGVARLLLVHNTYSQPEDLALARRFGGNLHWVLCPRANLFIEQRLPPAELLWREGASVALGTDSLASNSSLSILEEMRALNTGFPAIPFEALVRWSSLNGAEALGVSQTMGSFAVGKRPGAVQVSDFDFQRGGLVGSSRAKVLVTA